MPPADGSSTGAYRWCSHLANTSQAAPERLRRSTTYGLIRVMVSTHTVSKMYRFHLCGVGRTDKQTDGQARLDPSITLGLMPPYAVKRGIIT